MMLQDVPQPVPPVNRRYIMTKLAGAARTISRIPNPESRIPSLESRIPNTAKLASGNPAIAGQSLPFARKFAVASPSDLEVQPADRFF
jgi:hypothetical protein